MVPPIGTAYRPTLRRTTTLAILGALACLLAVPTVAFATPATAAVTVASPAVPVPASMAAPGPAVMTAPTGAHATISPLLTGPGRSLLPAHRTPLYQSLFGPAAIASARSSVGSSELNGAISSLSTGAGPAFGTSLTCTSSSATTASCANGRPAAPHPGYYGGYGWQNATSGAGTIEYPGNVAGGSMAWDAFDEVIIYFGGCDSHSCPDNQTWVYGGFWENITGYLGYYAPPAVSDASMDYDYDLGAVVLFGGCGAFVCPMNETWIFSGGYWINASGPYCYYSECFFAPPARFAASMAFENNTANNETVLFGGCLDFFCYTEADDTWVWDAPYAAWVPVLPDGSPSARAYASMVYDPVLGELVLFGGCQYSCFMSDTWEFSGSTWTNLTTEFAYYYATPEARGASEMTYDARLGEVILTGGVGQGPLNNTWELGCTYEYPYGSYCGWENITPSVNLPGGIYLGAMASESSSYQPLLTGGDCICVSNSLFETYVFEPLFTATPTVSPNPANINEVVSFSANLVGGSMPYYGTWYTGNASYYYNYGVLDTTSSYSAAGNYTVSLYAEDFYGVSFVYTTYEIVGTVAAQATVAHATDDVGASDAFSTTAASGGTSPYAYNWSFGDGTYGASADSVTHAYAAVGNYTANLTVMDLYGITNVTWVNVTVVPAPTVTAAASATSVDAGTALTFTPTAAGGVGAYTYSWAFGDTQTSTSTAPSHTFATSGTFKVTVTVTDSVGGTGTGSVSVTVNPAVSGTASATPTTVTAGGSVAFTATGSGGTGTYTYAWVFGDGTAKVTTATASHTYATAGSYNAWVWINDSLGGSFSHEIAITVQAPGGGSGSSSSSSSLPGWALWAVVGLVIVVVAALLIVMMSRRRKPPATAPTAPPTGAAGGPAPPPPPGAQ
jgi:PKD repeat protein